MLMRVLRRHPRVECLNENDPEGFDAYRLKDVATIDYLVARSRAEVVAFKPILDSQRAREILDDHSESKAIWLYRAYQDCVNSGLRQFSDHQGYLRAVLTGSESRDWPAQNVTEEDLKLVQRFHERGVTDAEARCIMWYLRNAQYFQQSLDADPRVRLECYEQLVSEPDTHFRLLFSFIGLSYHERFVRPVFSTSVRKNAFPQVGSEILELVESMHGRLQSAFEDQCGSGPSQGASKTTAEHRHTGA